PVSHSNQPCPARTFGFHTLHVSRHFKVERPYTVPRDTQEIRVDIAMVECQDEIEVEALNSLLTSARKSSDLINGPAVEREIDPFLYLLPIVCTAICYNENTAFDSGHAKELIDTAHLPSRKLRTIT